MSAKTPQGIYLFNTAAFVTGGSGTVAGSKEILLLSTSKIADNIGYSHTSGIFRVNDAGLYFVSWNIACTNASPAPAIVKVDFKQLTPSPSVIAKSSSVSEIRQNTSATLSGSAIFTATSGSTYAFINNSGVDITLNSEQATNVVVFKIN